MAIIPGQFCEDCAERGREGVPAVHELDSWGAGSGGGGFICDHCASNRYDAHMEAALESYWGASTPQTLQEQYDAAAKQKRDR